MSWCLLPLTVLLLVLAARGQKAIILIHISLIDGRTGQPMKHQRVGLENGADYRKISGRTNLFGIASLHISRNAVILAHNTRKYMNCLASQDRGS